MPSESSPDSSHQHDQTLDQRQLAELLASLMREEINGAGLDARKSHVIVRSDASKQPAGNSETSVGKH